MGGLAEAKQEAAQHGGRRVGRLSSHAAHPVLGNARLTDGLPDDGQPREQHNDQEASKRGGRQQQAQDPQTRRQAQWRLASRRQTERW